MGFVGFFFVCLKFPSPIYIPLSLARKGEEELVAISMCISILLKEQKKYNDRDKMVFTFPQVAKPATSGEH